MASEFKTLWELHQEGTFQELTSSAQGMTNNIPTFQINSGTASEQLIIGIIALIVVGMIFLPFGATENSIKACQIDTNQKVVKLGGAVIVLMTSISIIFFLEILELSKLIRNL